MSDKMECPGCESYSSTTLREFREDGQCGSCGLSAAAAEEILAVRERRGDEQLKEQLEAALVRAGKAESELARLRGRLNSARSSLRRMLETWEPD